MTYLRNVAPTAQPGFQSPPWGRSILFSTACQNPRLSLRFVFFLITSSQLFGNNCSNSLDILSDLFCGNLIMFYLFCVYSVQSLSCVRLFVTPWSAACQSSLSITNSWNLLKLTSIESVMPSNHLVLCRPLLLQPSIFSSIRVFSSESVLHIMWPKYWSFSFSISPSNEYSGLVSFRMDWLDLLAVQGTLKSLLQHHSLVQLSHPFMTTGKTIALIR